MFYDTESCETFLDLLEELPSRFGVRVHGFALMPNHFHLLLTAGPHGLGDAMQYLQGQYSRWLNTNRAWDGPIWRSRFKSRPVESEEYWRHLLAYVHLNPVKGGLVPRVDLSQWTSHAAYAGLSPAPAWLDMVEHLEIFGGVANYLEYLDDLNMGRDVAPDGFDPDALFRRKARVLPVAVEQPLELERPQDWPLTPEAAWLAIEMATGKDRCELAARPRGPGASALWWLTAWWLPLATGKRPAWWARELGVARSVVSRGRLRLEREVEKDAALARLKERLSALVGER